MCFPVRLVVRGDGLGEVIAIGAASEIGKIGQSLGHAGDRTAAAAGANPARWCESSPWLGAAVSVLAVSLRHLAGRMAGRRAGRHRARHVDAARKSSRSCSPSSWRWAPGESRGRAC